MFAENIVEYENEMDSYQEKQILLEELVEIMKLQENYGLTWENAVILRNAYLKRLIEITKDESERENLKLHLGVI